MLSKVINRQPGPVPKIGGIQPAKARQPIVRFISSTELKKAPPSKQTALNVPLGENVKVAGKPSAKPPAKPPGSPRGIDVTQDPVTSPQGTHLLSAYAQSLEREPLRRYREKISVIGHVDPYTLAERSGFPRPESLPDVAHGDIVNYFVFTTSAYTALEFKAYKSLQPFAAFAFGWVKAIWMEHFGDFVLLMGKVLHSQRLRDNPLTPWAILRPCGEIVSAHCTCMAGLGKACTHVASMIFKVENIVRTHHIPSVTEVAAYWMGSKKTVEFQRIKDIDFSQRHKKLEQQLKPEAASTKKTKQIPLLTKAEKRAFLKNLMDKGIDVVALTITSPFCGDLRDRHWAALLKYPPNLENLFKDVYRNLPPEQLYCVALSLDLSATEDSVRALERDTKKQASSNLWFKYRAGRVTASKFKNVCSTTVEKPSLSLVKSICYPSKFKFSTEATRWGCRHEKTARKAYAATMKKEHLNFFCENSGLLINPEYPLFGASPDGLVSCECCGDGCLEVKCPHCLRTKGREDILTNKSCLISVGDSASLDTNHSYYFQVQMQLFVSARDYCDFVLWTTRTIFIERIYPDEQFWTVHRQIATEFSLKVLLPELLGKCYTEPVRDPPASPPSGVSCSPRSQAALWTVQSVLPPTDDLPPDLPSPANVEPVVRSSPKSQASKWTVRSLPPTMEDDNRPDPHLKKPVVRCSPITDAAKWVAQTLYSPIIEVSIDPMTTPVQQATVACSPQSDASKWKVNDRDLGQPSSLIKKPVIRCSPITGASEWAVQTLYSPIIEIHVPTSSPVMPSSRSGIPPGVEQLPRQQS